MKFCVFFVSMVASVLVGFSAQAQGTRAFLEKFKGPSPVVFIGTLSRITDQKISDSSSAVLHVFCDAARVTGPVELSEDRCLSIYKQPFHPNVSYNGAFGDQLEVGRRYIVAARFHASGALFSYSILGGHLALMGDEGAAFVSSAKGSWSQDLWMSEGSLYLADRPGAVDDLPVLGDVLSFLIIAYAMTDDPEESSRHVGGSLYVYPRGYCPQVELVFSFTHGGRLFDVKVPGPFEGGTVYRLTPDTDRCNAQGRRRRPQVIVAAGESIEEIDFEELVIERPERGEGWLVLIKKLDGASADLQLKVMVSVSCLDSAADCAELAR